ncbi:MAG: hypothetical protein CVU40_16250 [Chloroflexi bacterium HGW-Chloroflexi-2]|nr:MAG: hypothetical protein CVU40_16250 [Chloroflexi bacterium HGW-Chloroflexi-2]
MTRSSKLPLVALILPLLVSLACNFSPGGSDSDDESNSSTLPTSETSGTVRTIPTSEPGAEPTSLPAIASSSSSSDSMSDSVLVMKEPIYIQDERNLITVFLFENLDSDGVEDIEYTITVTDAAGTTLKTENGYIDFIAAGGKTGVASQMFLDEGMLADNVNIEWTYYMDAVGSEVNPFSFSNSRYYFDPYWDRFTTVMTNNSATTYTYVRVDMLAYDAAGLVVGGGYTTLNFLPGNSSVGLSINGFVSDDPVTYEFFPKLNILSNETNDANLFTDLSILKTGFYYDETNLGGGFLVQNTTNEVMRGAEYHLTIFEDDGSVAQIASGIISLIWPGQTIGVSPGAVTLSEGAAPVDFKVNVMAGDPANQEFSSNPLSIQSSTFIDDNLYPFVSVTIANDHNQEINNPYVTVILYDAADEIIGGGYTYPDPVPANGTLTYDVYVTNATSGLPDRIEAFVSLTSY